MSYTSLSMSNLTDRIIVVTGGEGLLGKEFVSHCRQAGATAISADIHCKTDLDKGTVHMDITNSDSIRSCVQEVQKKFGALHGWINNAYPRTADWGLPFEKIPPASWDQNVQMHLGGYFRCCQVVLEHMKQAKTGSLINIGSIYGFEAPDFSLYEGTTMTMPAAYSAIKGGIINLTRYLAAYYGSHGVRVNAISPGGIFDDQIDTFVKRYEAHTPLRRMAIPKDIAPAAAFLLSEDACYITGHNLVVDGGWSL